MSLKNKKALKLEHEHDHLDKLVSQNVTIVFALNLFFAILEFIFGVIFNSTAILSDAVHDTGDAVAIGLAWFFQKFFLNVGRINISLLVINVLVYLAPH